MPGRTTTSWLPPRITSTVVAARPLGSMSAILAMHPQLARWVRHGDDGEEARPGWQVHVKGCALAGDRAYVDEAGVPADDLMSDGEPEAGALAPRGEEGVENAVDRVGLDANAIVAHFDADVVATFQPVG